jgi:hypothetical protein
MKFSTIVTSVFAFFSILGFSVSGASALENRVGIRTECGSSTQTISGTQMKFDKFEQNSTYTDKVNIEGGSKVVTGTEYRSGSAEQNLNVHGVTNTNFTGVEGFVIIN